MARAKINVRVTKITHNGVKTTKTFKDVSTECNVYMVVNKENISKIMDMVLNHEDVIEMQKFTSFKHQDNVVEAIKIISDHTVDEFSRNSAFDQKGTMSFDCNVERPMVFDKLYIDVEWNAEPLVAIADLEKDECVVVYPVVVENDTTASMLDKALVNINQGYISRNEPEEIKKVIRSHLLSLSEGILPIYKRIATKLQLEKMDINITKDNIVIGRFFNAGSVVIKDENIEIYVKIVKVKLDK